MKRLVIFCAALAALAACSSNDEIPVQVSDETHSTFDEMYPGARGVMWEKRGSLYRVAVFEYDGRRLSAWYNQDGVWCLTEERMDNSAAPARVTGAYRLDALQVNMADHVDRLIRDGIEDVYVVVEGAGDNRAEYYYSMDGITVKILDKHSRIYEDYRGEIVPPIPPVVYSTAGRLCPGGRVMEVDVIFPGILYLDVIHDNRLKKMEFSLTGAWSMTTWPVTESYVRSQCPDVYEAYTSQGYMESCRIMSIDFVESPSIVYYRFLIDNNGSQADIKINDQGNIIAVS